MKHLMMFAFVTALAAGCSKKTPSCEEIYEHTKSLAPPEMRDMMDKQKEMVSLVSNMLRSMHDARMATIACHRTRIVSHGLLGSFPSLTGLAANLFALITNTLTMIRFRRSNAADFSRRLTNDLTVVTIYLDLAGF